MLTTETVALYLLERRLLDSRVIVEGDLVVVEASRRNSNFRVVCERGPSYLVKQGFGPRRAAGIANEAAIHSLLRGGIHSRQKLSRYLPFFRFHDSEEHVLITDLLPNAELLGDHQRRIGRFSTAIAADIGKALSVLHTRFTGQDECSPCEPPWVLSAHHATIALYRQMSNANLQLLRILQSAPSAGNRLDELRQSWQHSSMIHYDLKLENLVVTRPKGQHKRTRIKLVDWELAGMGDPLWDVGSLLGEYLAAWLLSIPVTGGHSPDRFLELARYPLIKIQPAMRAFWQAYTGGTHPGGKSPAHWPARAAAYAAARLIQTAFERNQTEAVPTGEALVLSQVGINILERPQEAAIHLLGIPPTNLGFGC